MRSKKIEKQAQRKREQLGGASGREWRLKRGKVTKDASFQL